MLPPEGLAAAGGLVLTLNVSCASAEVAAIARTAIAAVINRRMRFFPSDDLAFAAIGRDGILHPRKAKVQIFSGSRQPNSRPLPSREGEQEREG